MNEKKEGTDIKNLSFFKEFLTTTGVSFNWLAGQMGITTPSVFYWFRKDNINLSYIIQAADILGYNVYVSVSDNMEDIMEVDEVVTNDGGKMYVKRLHFLSYAMKKAKLTKTQLAVELGMAREAVTYWFGKDDISIQNLIACAKILNQNINFRFIKRKTDIKPSRNDIVLHSSIVTNSSWIIA